MIESACINKRKVVAVFMSTMKTFKHSLRLLKRLRLSSFPWLCSIVENKRAEYRIHGLRQLEDWILMPAVASARWHSRVIVAYFHWSCPSWLFIRLRPLQRILPIAICVNIESISMCRYLWGLLGITVAAFGGAIALAGVLFYYFNPSGEDDCSFNITAICFTLFLGCLITAVSMSPFVRPSSHRLHLVCMQPGWTYFVWPLWLLKAFHNFLM